jgi:hypothetical protein
MIKHIQSQKFLYIKELHTLRIIGDFIQNYYYQLQLTINKNQHANL